METVPPPLATDQVTAVFVEPVTVAVNCCVAPVVTVALFGVTLTLTAVGAFTVTLALAFLVVSAALVAVTVYVPAVLGAVNRPLEETDPLLADQVTAVLVEPVTVALNCCVAPVLIVALVGATLMPTVTGAFTVTLALAVWVVSAALVALTV